MGEGDVRFIGKYKGNMLCNASRPLLEVGVVIAQRESSTSARVVLKRKHSFGSGTSGERLGSLD
jgi:hypothetical protein